MDFITTVGMWTMTILSTIFLICIYIGIYKFNVLFLEGVYKIVIHIISIVELSIALFLFYAVLKFIFKDFATVLLMIFFGGYLSLL